jgi:CheY-like chemotaxis protein
MSTGSRRDNAKVLLIEDEPLLRASIVRGLAKLPGVEVIDAGTLREALLILESTRPQLVLSDLNLPDGNGLAVLSALDRLRLGCPVVFLSAYLGSYRSRIPLRATVEALEKPVPLDVLRRMVQEKLDLQMTGDSPFTPADYVQLAGMGRHTVEIAVEHDGAPMGEIIVHGGEAWSARDQQGQGEGAFGRLVLAQGVTTECRTLRAEKVGRRNLHASWSSMLLAAVKDQDEAQARPRPLLAHGTGADTSGRDDGRFDVLFDEGVGALLHKDYATAARAFRAAEALRPGDAKVTTNLARLRELGFTGEGR